MIPPPLTVGLTLCRYVMDGEWVAQLRFQVSEGESI